MCVKHQSLAAHPALFQPQSSVIKAGHFFFFLEHSSSASDIFYPSPEEKSIIIMKYFFFLGGEFKAKYKTIKKYIYIPEEYEAALILYETFG